MGTRYECREDGASKFWEVSNPVDIDGQWAVVVRFGKINGWEQTRTHVEQTKWQADRYHADKVAEKLKKGYSAAYVNTKSPKLSGIQQAAKGPGYGAYQPSGISSEAFGLPVIPKATVKAAPPCVHDNLSRKGNAWECKACRTVVENLYQGAIPEPEFKKKVRRFFDLSARTTTT